MSQVKTTQGYLIESAIINSTRQLEPLDIGPIISDIEIFEHLDLPYLTGQIAMMDTFRLYDRLDFQGAETIILSIKQSEKDEPVVKTFVIDKLIANKKTNEQTDLIMFHIVEDIVFKSNLQNVNKAYSGDPIDIVTKISEEWLNKKIDSYITDVFQKKIKVIVPNLSPLDAMAWMKNRATTSKGFPTYLFSSFATENLIAYDLKQLMERQPINIKSPFIFGVSNHDMEILPFKHVPIKDYSIEDIEDLYALIDEGLVGAEHEFIDTHTFRRKTHKFNVELDVFENLLEGKKENKITTFANNFEIDDVSLQNYKSKKIVQVTQSGAYDDGTARYKSYDQEFEGSDDAKKIMARAMKKFLLKAPISIRIDGAGFIDGKGHYTTGNTVRILFLANRPQTAGNVKLDLKKSGDYLIYQAKHAFGSSRYNIHLKCVKLSNFTDDNPLKVIG